MDPVSSEGGSSVDFYNEKVVVIVPAFNEEETIVPIIKRSKRTAPVLVVDDGSVDNTAEVARLAGATVVSLCRNVGVDNALAFGFKTAAELGYQVIATIDADGQHDPDLLPSIIEPVASNRFDLCHSARLDYARPTEWILRKYSKAIHGYRDILSGLKCFRIDIYLEDPEFASSNALGTAIPWLSWKRDLRIEQLDITAIERKDTPRIGGIIRGNWKVIKALGFLIYWDLFKS